MTVTLSLQDLSIRTIVPLLLPYLPYALVFVIVTSYAKTWYRLRQFHGPWFASISYLWVAAVAVSGRMNFKYTEINRKYGPLARIGPNTLITDDPDIVRHMSSARSPYTRSGWYEGVRVDPYEDNVMSTMDVAAHDKIRAKMAGGYAGKENPDLEAEIDEQIASFISLIHRRYLSKGATLRPMDFGQKAQYFTLDVITKIAYGKEFGFVANDEDVHEYIKTTEETVPFLAFLTMVPWANSFFNKSWVRELVGPSPKDKHGVGKLMGVAKEVVGERFGSDKKEKLDMLGAFVRNGLSQRRIESEVLFQIIAGSDTTATGLRATILYLITAPRVMEKLRAEIDAAEAAGIISNPIQNAEAKGLPFLQACIKEGLRIHPPFTGLVMKKVPPSGDTIKGQYVPGNTSIGHNTWSIQRNEVYGEDPEIYRPERWIDADSETVVQMERTLELVFGYGRWGCLGKSIAYMELNKFFVELIRRFDIELVDPTNPWKCTNFNLFFMDHMLLRIAEREPKQSPKK